MAVSIERQLKEFEQARKENEIEREKLLSPDYIEKLVLNGKVPMVIDVSSGIKGESNYSELSFVFIPPEGTAFHDKAHFRTLGGSWEFFHDNKHIGNANLIEVSRDEGFGIMMKTRNVLDNIGFKTISPYENISEEECFALLDAEN
jgi:hypothetical protein